MKTTVEIPDDLFRRAKARAALEGLSLRELVSYGLRLALQTPLQSARPSRATFPLIRSRPGSAPLSEAETSAALTEMDDEEARRYANAVRR